MIFIWKDLSLNPSELDLRLSEGPSDVLRIILISPVKGNGKPNVEAMWSVHLRTFRSEEGRLLGVFVITQDAELGTQI